MCTCLYWNGTIITNQSRPTKDHEIYYKAQLNFLCRHSSRVARAQPADSAHGTISTNAQIRQSVTYRRWSYRQVWLKRVRQKIRYEFQCGTRLLGYRSAFIVIFSVAHWKHGRHPTTFRLLLGHLQGRSAGASDLKQRSDLQPGQASIACIPIGLARRVSMAKSVILLEIAMAMTNSWQFPTRNLFSGQAGEQLISRGAWIVAAIFTIAEAIFSPITHSSHQSNFKASKPLHRMDKAPTHEILDLPIKKREKTSSPLEL